MSTNTVPQVRTVRASNPATTSQTKPLSPAEAALKALAKADPKTEQGKAALVAMRPFVAGDARIAESTAQVDAATEALKAFRTERDALITYQRRAIKTALVRGFQGKDIAETFGVAPGSVSFVKGALDLRDALVKGGMPASEAPSVESLTSRLTNLKGKRADIIKHARTTGTLPEAAETEPERTAAQVLKAVQAAHTALKHLKRAEGDDETVTAIYAQISAMVAFVS